MSVNRLGTLLAGLVGIGWSAALLVTAIVWLPALAGVDPFFYEDGRQFLTFVGENPVSWRVFHLGATTALLAQLFLVELLTSPLTAELKPVMRLTGLAGTALALLASLIDQLVTPVLAAWGGQGNVPVAVFIWESVEPLRDNGFKTLSFLLLGVWLVWLGGRPLAKSITRASRWLGIGLLFLGLFEAVVPLPWRNQYGETGFLGLILFGVPIWAFLVARDYWQKELAINH